MTVSGAQTSIIDNQEGNTLALGIENITGGVRELWIATAFFSLDALALVAKNLHQCDQVRILFGDDADRRQRQKLLQEMRDRSDGDLVEQRLIDPTLDSLRKVQELFKQGRINARCYTAKKFHAKAYLSYREHHPQFMGILGSGNFTRPGLTRNVELNVELTTDQTAQLHAWYEARWAEAVEDDVTDAVQKEIKRQLDLYDPYAIYCKALLTWGDWVQGRNAMPEYNVLKILDPHQDDAFRQALKVISREGGVLLTDGVGLGKSFVALALMEHFLANGMRVFLVAPKAILTASWELYLTEFLDRYRRGYKSLVHEAMTWFGFDPTSPRAAEDKAKDLLEYWRQAQVVVIDESHNFRKTDSNRYANMLQMLGTGPLGRKIVILLTATPINTEFQDLTAQFRLITHEKGTLGGISIENYQKHAAGLDSEHRRRAAEQLEFDYQMGHASLGLLESGLKVAAIQRSRKTCKELAAAKGKVLHFPDREPIAVAKYDLSPLYKEVVGHTKTEFEELAKFLIAYRSEVSRASQEKDEAKRRLKLKLPDRGLRFSAYLPDRYRKHPEESLREANVESTLVSLVFTNVMKQLESSSVAFQGILQALGAGLCARLKYTASQGDLPVAEVDSVIQAHTDWIGRDVRDLAAEEDEEEEDGAAADASGAEMDEWLERALRVNSVRKGLAGFSAETHEVVKWRKHIEGDLDILRDVHQRTVAARQMADDQKLLDVNAHIAKQLEKGRKILLFTQSRRTAEYLERELKERYGKQVARIDASIDGDRRRRILYAFSPRYNPMLQPPLQFDPINILISTDVLSEGVNLQEAGCILNYDIHWNPVRLIQRIGRVDRRLREDDPGHTFAIINVFPPKEIEDIIELVGTVEGRKRKITSLLGLDQAFFSTDDPEGTLKEFNRELEGEVNLLDEGLKRYVHLTSASPEMVEIAEAVPPGAFGVWSDAPVSGVCAVFEMTPTLDAHGKERITPEEKYRYKWAVGMPVLALMAEGKISLDAPEILDLLSQAEPKQRSGDPGDPAVIREALKDMKNAANQSFRAMNLHSAIQPKLVCWMELRK